MMKSKVYIETTIVSYLVASPTQDIVQSAYQQITRQWWAGSRSIRSIRLKNGCGGGSPWRR